MAQGTRRRHYVQGISQRRTAHAASSSGWLDGASLRELLLAPAAAVLGSSRRRQSQWSGQKTEDNFGTESDIRALDQRAQRAAAAAAAAAPQQHRLSRGAPPWHGQQLRVLTRDVSAGGGSDGGDGGSGVAPHALTAVLAACDVACMQGITSAVQLDALRRAATAAELHFSRVFYQGGSSSGGGGGGRRRSSTAHPSPALLVASRYPITASYYEHFHVQSYGGGGGEGAGLVRLHTPAGAVDVYVAALRGDPGSGCSGDGDGGGGDGDAVMPAQAFQLAHFISHTRRAPLSLLAGSVGDSPSAALAAALQLSVAAMRDVRAEVALAATTAATPTSAGGAHGSAILSSTDEHTNGGASYANGDTAAAAASAASAGAAAQSPQATSFLFFSSEPSVTPTVAVEPLWVAGTCRDAGDVATAAAADAALSPVRGGVRGDVHGGAVKTSWGRRNQEAARGGSAVSFWRRLRPGAARTQPPLSGGGGGAECGGGLVASFTAFDPDGDDVAAHMSAAAAHAGATPLRGPILAQLRSTIQHAIDSLSVDGGGSGGGRRHHSRDVSWRDLVPSATTVVLLLAAVAVVVLAAGIVPARATTAAAVALIAIAAAAAAGAAAEAATAARAARACGLREVAAQLRNFENHLCIEDAFPSAGTESQLHTFMAHYLS